MSMPTMKSCIHLFIYLSPSAPKYKIVLLIYSVIPCLLLLHVGTKVTCQEGGCGSCVVALTKQDMSTRKDKTIAVNSV